MVSADLATGLITVSISSISVLALVCLRVYNICIDIQNKGNWKENSWEMTEYKLFFFLKTAIYLGGVAGLMSLYMLYRTLHFRPSFNYDIESSLTFIIMSLISVEVSSILIGIKYLDERITS